jgi:hypothetical protein
MQGGILIEDNLIEHSLGNYSYDIAVAGVDTEVVIRGNVLRGANLAGILLGESSSSFTIEDNVIEPGAPFDLDFAYGAATLIRGSADLPFRVVDNVLSCDSPFADCLAVAGTELPIDEIYGLPRPVPSNDLVSRAVIARNHITAHNDTPNPGTISFFPFSSAISVYGSVRKSLFSANTIVGNGDYGLAATWLYLETDITDSDLFVGNDFSHYTSSRVDLFFDTSTRNNTYVGKVDGITDVGSGNRFLGPKKVSHPGAGPQSRQALSSNASRLRSLLIGDGPTDVDVFHRLDNWSPTH